MHIASSNNLRASLAPSNHVQVAAIFEDKAAAQKTIKQLTNTKDINADQVSLIDATEDALSEKLEKESKTMGKRLWHSHLALGVLGLVSGLIFASLLVSFGPALTQQNPLFTYIALVSPGIFTGLFVAGLIGLRPDRSEIVQIVRHAIRRNNVAIIVNLNKNQSIADISDFLNQHSSKVVEAVR